MIKRIVLIALPALPVAAWAVVKPMRVLAPQLAGLTCHGNVCVDDLSRLSEATGVYENAVRYVRDNVGEFQSEPRAVFAQRKRAPSPSALGQRLRTTSQLLAL
jgi:hypothetical protein